jgi:hypothetical protein
MPQLRPVKFFIDFFPSLDPTIIEAIYLSAVVSGKSGAESTITDDQLVDELLKICSDDELPPQPAPSTRQPPLSAPTVSAKPQEAPASRSTPAAAHPPSVQSDAMTVARDPPRMLVSPAAVQTPTAAPAVAAPLRPQDYAPAAKPSPTITQPHARDVTSPAAPRSPSPAAHVAPVAHQYPPIAAVLMVWDYDNLPPPQHRPAQTVFQAIRSAVEQACTAHPKFSGMQPLASWEKIAFYVSGHRYALTESEHEDLRTLSVSTICCTKRKEDADRQITAKVQEEVRKYLRRDASPAVGSGGPLQDMLVVLLSSDKDFCHLVEETGQRGFPVCVVHDADPGSRHELSLRTFPAFDLSLRQLLGPCAPRGGHVGERRQGAVVRFNAVNRIGDIVDRLSREVLFFICDDPELDVGCDVEYALAPDVKKPGKMKAVRVQRLGPASPSPSSTQGGGAVKLLSPSAVTAVPTQPWVHREPPPRAGQAQPAAHKKLARQDVVSHVESHHDPNIFAALERRSGACGEAPNGRQHKQPRHGLSTPPTSQDDSGDDDDDNGSPSSAACPPIPSELVQQVKDMSGAVDTAWVKFCLAAAVRNGEVDVGLAILHVTGTPIKSKYKRRVERGYGWRCPANPATAAAVAPAGGVAALTATCSGAPLPPRPVGVSAAAAGLDGLSQDDPQGFLFGRLRDVAQQLGLQHCDPPVIQRCIRAAHGQYDVAVDLMLAADAIPPPAPRPAVAVRAAGVGFRIAGHGGVHGVPANLVGVPAASSQAPPLRPAAAASALPGRPSAVGGFVGMHEPD